MFFARASRELRCRYLLNVCVTCQSRKNSNVVGSSLFLKLPLYLNSKMIVMPLHAISKYIKIISLYLNSKKIIKQNSAVVRDAYVWRMIIITLSSYCLLTSEAVGVLWFVHLQCIECWTVDFCLFSTSVFCLSIDITFKSIIQQCPKLNPGDWVFRAIQCRNNQCRVKIE